MDYKIITLDEKKVAGVSNVTNNSSPDSTQVIGELWKKFYGEAIGKLKGKSNEKCIGLYTDYQQNGDYKVMVCAEVNSINQDVDAMTIPAGKYAKFVVKGNIVTAVQAFWQELWNMELDRAFVCDFEEYQGGEDIDNMEIHMYISLK